MDPHRNLTKFDRYGRLVSVADAIKVSPTTGNETMINYDLRSRLVAVVDAVGRCAHLDYFSEEGFIDTIRDPVDREGQRESIAWNQRISR